MDRKKPQTKQSRVGLSFFSLPMFLVLVILSIGCTFLAKGDGPAAGEASATRWMSSNSLFFVDFFASISDPLLTDLAAPIVFTFLVLAVWYLWGRYPAVILGLAGAFTGLTRIGDLVHRPRPTSTGEWIEYSFGNGGYPSGHVIFSVLIFGTIWILSAERTSILTSKLIGFGFLAIVVLTCWSRVSELEHWPLDVVGGLLMSSAALILVSFANKALPDLISENSSLKQLLGLDKGVLGNKDA
ncbi:MAG: phosphatase PAP2 family protein [Acidimicrobiales bacterium]|nr:phosphatase PAP2 family protein [Acidimicrobiales bacterium]